MQYAGNLLVVGGFDRLCDFCWLGRVVIGWFVVLAVLCAAVGFVGDFRGWSGGYVGSHLCLLVSLLGIGERVL